MDYIYICRAGENEELRYSIRSLVKNLPNPNIWVVGYKPEWYVGNFMPVEDISSKFNNIYNALMKVCDNDDIAEEFVLMNDDFFITKEIDSISAMHGGLLKDKIDSYRDIVGDSRYVRILRSTYDFLLKVGVANPIDYDIHVPMPMSRSLLKEVAIMHLFPRSMYGNLTVAGGTEVKDVKTYGDNSLMSIRSNDFTKTDLPFISTEDKSFSIVYEELLKDMFSEPSQYERKLH